METGNARVLVVEDERTINQAVADRLSAESFAVRQAYDGPGAVEGASTTSAVLPHCGDLRSYALLEGVGPLEVTR